MPNQPKTPLRSFRVDDDLWKAAVLKARAEGMSVTSVILRGLEEFVASSSSA